MLSLLFLLSIPWKGNAQSENYRFEHLSVQQGLSQNSVWSILQDREGFMWFGTQDGLNKYDGYTFTVFKPDPRDPEHTLHHNMISDIHEDRKGRLWVTTLGGGFYQVDKHTGNVTHQSIGPNNARSWNAFASIYEDQQGLLWISGAEGVASFDPETKQFTLYTAPDERAPLFTAVTEDAAGRFWASSRSGVYQLDRNSGKFTPVALDSSFAQKPVHSSLYLDKEGMLWVDTGGEGLFYMDTRDKPLHFTRYNPGGIVNKRIRFNCIYEDNSGYLWLSGSQGLQRIDKQTDEVLNFQSNPSQPGSLSHNNVTAVYQDRTGTLWIGTDNGVNKIKAHAKKFHTYQIIPALPSVVLDQNNIGTLLEDHTGKIWMGSAGSSFFGNFQNGLFQLDPKTKHIKHFPADPSNPDSLASNQVWSLYEDQKKRLWVGTQEALHLLDSTTGKFSRYPSVVPVEYIEEDIFGKLWMGTWRSDRDEFLASFDPDKEAFKYYTYDPKDTTGLKDKNMWDIVASRSGDIWIALSGGGIARLDQQTGKFTSYLNNPSAAQGHLNDKDVRALYEDEKGVIWAGTNQGGLHRFDSLTNTFTYFTMQDGLPSNHVVSIIGDDNGNLWLGTNKGLSNFNPDTKTFRNFDISDGLPANEFRIGSVYSRNGRLMFGTVNGFVIFHPDSIKDNPVVPPVYITGFQVLEKSRNVPTKQVELPYDENFLSFEFVALNYDTPEKNQYAYKMEGLDKDWVYSGTRRFASYPDLDPGKYVFRVKGSNNDGVWNEQGASLQLTILPPFWQTWWAYSLYGMLALGFLYSLRQYTVKRERLKHALKLQTLEAEKMHEIDHMKSRFFANISHEFRTPITLILGPLKALYEGTYIGDQKTVFGLMMRNSQRLLRLINQLLDISKLEAGKMQLQVVETDLVVFLRHVASSYESLAADKKIRYFFYPEMPELMVLVDQEKMEKIVHNLLSNAFKFTAEGGEVILYLKTEANQWAVISVKDTGTGIPQDELEKVFDRFYQVGSSQTRAQEGSGLGMALSKELTELHHGRITVESMEGKGTTFTVRLPLGKAHLSREAIRDQRDIEESKLSDVLQIPDELSVAATEIEALTAAATSTMVLVVEDNADMRQYIRNTLGDHYQIKEAKNGREGIGIAMEHLPDLIISDVMMPEMDGYALCEKIKTDELTSHIPVILLTAKADRKSKLAGLEIGADDYLAKPFDAEELLLIVRNRIEERRKLQERFSREITLQPRAITITSVDEQFLQRVMQIMEEHMADAGFGVEALGLEVGMSRMQLFRKLKALTNHAPGDFIRLMRLKRAAALLTQGAGNIAEVAFQVGFQDPSYFTKSFQKQFGQTPSEYIVRAIDSF